MYSIVVRQLSSLQCDPPDNSKYLPGIIHGYYNIIACLPYAEFKSLWLFVTANLYLSIPSPFHPSPNSPHLWQTSFCSFSEEETEALGQRDLPSVSSLVAELDLEGRNPDTQSRALSSPLLISTRRYFKKDSILNSAHLLLNIMYSIFFLTP